MLKTAQKISLAKVAYSIIMPPRRLFGLTERAQVTRSGIRWELELGEGIDFSIYLLGGFELRTQRLYRKLVKPGDTILDIGANIGSHTLPLARLVGSGGKVFAFEPTNFAYRKLQRNIALNQELSPRIVAEQAMLTAPTQTSIPLAFFARWPLRACGEVHTQHKGRLESSSGGHATTVDEVVHREGIARVALVKLDVDGYESCVLQGATKTLERDRPIVLLEIAPYLFDDRREDLSRIVAVFRQHDYVWFDANTKLPLPLEADRLSQLIPRGASCNVLARIQGAE